MVNLNLKRNYFNFLVKINNYLSNYSDINFKLKGSIQAYLLSSPLNNKI